MLFKSDSDIFVVSAGFIGFIGKQNIKFHHLRDATGPVIRLPLDNKFVALWPNHATAFSVETGAPSASTKIWVPLTNMVCQRLPNKDLALPQKSWREFADAVYDRNGYFDRLFLDTTVNEMKRLQGTLNGHCYRRGIATEGCPGRLPCVVPAPTGPSGKRISMNGQRCSWRAAGNTNASTKGSNGAYIPCGLTAARRDIGAAHQGPGEAGSLGN